MSEDKRKSLRDVLDELDRYFEEFEKEIQDFVRDGLSNTRVPPKPFVAGFQMRMGPGRPSVQFFGDQPVRGNGFRVPLTEQAVDEKAGLLRLVLDMPGVDKKDIEISAREGSVMVAAEAEGRKYKSEVQLRSQVELDSGKAEFKNGVLEISFSLKDKPNKGYRRVNVV